MEYKFLDKSIQTENIILPNSDKINPFLLRNNYADIIKAVDFIASDEKLLYVHGFMGTGKRQFINYICDFLDKEVIKLEYYCKEATVCDDILLTFTESIESLPISKAVNLNTKITTLNVKLKQQLSSIKKPILLILHSFDDILEENLNLVKEFFADIAKEENIKLIISTRAMLTNVLNDTQTDRKIFLKALTKDIFKEFLESNKLTVTETIINDFYKYTRGYYYYVALSIKIMQAMKIDLSEFLHKFNQSEMDFDSYLGITYINLLPSTIRNFFWFLRTVRHGLTLNALAELELYDEFSIDYLKANLMIFEVDDTIYVQDYFLQKIDISIPEKTQIKLHKYIIGIYESQLKIPIKERAFLISRQAMRAEIEYHNRCIQDIQNNGVEDKPNKEQSTIIQETPKEDEKTKQKPSLVEKLDIAKKLMQDKKYTDAIEAFNNILETENIDLLSVVESRLYLARLYKLIENNNMASHYYDLVETYYKQHKELINLNYLYYETADLYFKMYKHDRAIETIKKVIYSVDTPQSLMVQACTLLGNIYSEINNYNDAYSYYQKALESLDEHTEKEVLAELCFKFALANDDKEDFPKAFEYYNKCIVIEGNHPFKAMSYSNLASCYLESENYSDALDCFQRAYDIEKTNNNYEGIYYNSSHIAQILIMQNSKTALNYLLEAKKSAEFINEDFYILESTIALGDYYYNIKQNSNEALIEYFKARKIAERLSRDVDISKIEQRIQDMKLRMNEQEFISLENKYAR